jgi:hypothetical protein
MVACRALSKMTAETEAAMDGTKRSCYHEGSAAVLPQQTPAANDTRLAERISAVSGDLGQLGRPR